MATPKLSIIVPIYNVEPYLRKCVESLLTQDLDPAEYEIILVDDGSPDGCPAICDEYAQTLHPSGGSRKGANIKVIHQPNGGLSAARNTGIMAAKGDYVCFVDSDDYLQPNVLRELVEQMEHEDLDVLRFDYQNVRITQAGDYEVFQPYKHPHQVDTRTDVVDGETYLNERMNYACYAVQFIIRRSLLSNQSSVVSTQCSEDSNQKSPILFTPGIHFEDVDWTPRMLLAAKRVNGTRTIVYNYLLREGSITGTINITDKRRNLEDSLRVVEILGALYTQYPQCTWLKNMQGLMVSGDLCTIAVCFYGERETYLRSIRQLNVFPLCIANQGGTYVRRAKIINLSIGLFLLMMNLRYRQWMFVYGVWRHNVSVCTHC